MPWADPLTINMTLRVRFSFSAVNALLLVALRCFPTCASLEFGWPIMNWVDRHCRGCFSNNNNSVASIVQFWCQESTGFTLMRLPLAARQWHSLERKKPGCFRGPRAWQRPCNTPGIRDSYDVRAVELLSRSLKCLALPLQGSAMIMLCLS